MTPRRATLLFLLGLLLLAPPVATATAQLRICLTGGNVKVKKLYGEAFYQGAQLGLESRSNQTITVDLRQHYYDPMPLAPITAFKEMMQDLCGVIVGFDTTNDLMAVKSLADKSHPLIVSLYGRLNETLAAAPLLTSLQPPVVSFVNTLMHFMTHDKGHQFNNSLLITSVDSADLLAYRDAYASALTALGARVAQISLLESGFSAAALLAQYTPPYDSIFILTRSPIAAAAAAALYDYHHGENLPIFFGTLYFGTAAHPAFSELLDHRPLTAYFSRMETSDDPDPRFVAFAAEYRMKYHVEPMAISALAYDAVRYVLELASHIDTRTGQIVAVTGTELLAAVQDVQFSGITGVEFNRAFRPRHTKSFIIFIDEYGQYHATRQPGATP